MPRYYFDLDDNGVETVDPDGIFCPDLGKAKKEAVTALVAMISDELPDGDHHTMAIRVRDDSGEIKIHVALNFDVIADRSMPMERVP